MRRPPSNLCLRTRAIRGVGLSCGDLGALIDGQDEAKQSLCKADKKSKQHGEHLEHADAATTIYPSCTYHKALER